MQEMEREVTASPTGQRYADLVRRHFTEAQELINKNRRVATVWHRNGGPQIVQSLLQMARHHDRTIPAEINGSPLADCLARIQTMLTRYASPALSHDLREYGTFLRRLAGLTYPQVLAVLQDTATE